jgi:hypothetical protein
MKADDFRSIAQQLISLMKLIYGLRHLSKKYNFQINYINKTDPYL